MPKYKCNIIEDSFGYFTADITVNAKNKNEAIFKIQNGDYIVEDSIIQLTTKPTKAELNGNKLLQVLEDILLFNSVEEIKKYVKSNIELYSGDLETQIENLEKL